MKTRISIILFSLLISSSVYAADTALVGMTADGSPTTDDLMYTTNDPSGTPADRKVTLGNLRTLILTGTAATATALAANGGNCSAGSYPLGVDASGAVESCTDATTEISSLISSAIGVSTQAYDVDLTTYAGITPSADVQTFLGSANYAAMTGLPYQTVLTNSAGLAGALSDETGSGLSVFGTSPTISTPILTLQDGNGAAPTTDGQIKYDRTTERLQVGDGVSTTEFYSSPPNVTPVDTTDENATFYPLLVDGATGSQATETDGEYSYNPSTDTLTVGNISMSTQAIADNSIVTVDDADAADGNVAIFTANGIEGVGTLTGLNFLIGVPSDSTVDTLLGRDANYNLTLGNSGSSTEIFMSTLDEDNMASNSATNTATQQSIKAYVDTQVGTKIGDIVDDTTPQLGGNLDGQTYNIVTTGKIQGAVSGATSTGGALTINTMTIATAAGDYDLPDSCDSATFNWVCVYVRDVSETVSLTVTGAEDTIVYKGLSLNADDELDSPGAAQDSVCVVCMEANLWYVTSNSGSWTDGGPAD